MRTLLVSASLAAMAASATAQCFDQVYGTSLGSGGDVVFSMQPIGFAFPLGGATYTDIHVTTKGFAYLSNAGVPAPLGPDFDATETELVQGPPRVCALWADIQCLTGEVFIKSTPTTCTVTWSNAQCYASSSPIFSMQMALSSSGTVEFTYGPGTTNNSTNIPAWQVGLTGISPGMGVPQPASLDLSAGGATLDNTVHEFFPLPNGFDMANNGLLLIPTSPGWTYIPLGAPVNCAATSDYGTGCVAKEDSAVELLSTLSFDLAGATLVFSRQPDGYLLSNGAGSIVPPSASAVVVANFNDTEEQVALSTNMPVANGTTSMLTICSNGFIALSDQFNGSDYIPTIPTFLDFPETTIAADWHDYDPLLLGSGSILFEEVGGLAYVTWNGVYSYGTFSPNTFQYQFNLATGDVTIVYGVFAISGNDHLVGYSVGGASPTALTLDMSAIPTPVAIADSRFGLTLTATNVPYLGNPAFTLTTSHIPPVLPFGFLFFGDTVVNPGLDLTFLGMPTCSGYTNANLASATFPVFGSSGSVSFPIPSNPGLVGATLSCQSVAASPETPAGLITSNGTQFTVGN